MHSDYLEYIEEFKETFNLAKDVSKKDAYMLTTMIGMDVCFLIFKAPLMLYSIYVNAVPTAYVAFINTTLNILTLFLNTFSFFIYYICHKGFNADAKNYFFAAVQIKFYQKPMVLLLQ